MGETGLALQELTKNKVWAFHWYCLGDVAERHTQLLAKSAQTWWLFFHLITVPCCAYHRSTGGADLLTPCHSFKKSPPGGKSSLC